MQRRRKGKQGNGGWSVAFAETGAGGGGERAARPVSRGTRKAKLRVRLLLGQDRH